MQISVKLKENKIREKVTNDGFGRKVSTEWKRLTDPYVPRRTGMLVSNVSILPFKLHYKQNYASAVYNGVNRKFSKNKSPYATDHWDKKAEAAGQKTKLYQALNG